MFEKDKIKYFKTNGFEFYIKIFKSKKRKSLFKLVAYLFDKEFILKKDFSLERIADRAGILSLCLSNAILKKIIIEKGLEIESSEIKIFNFLIGNNFIDRLLIFFIYLISPNLIELKIKFFNFEEFS